MSISGKRRCWWRQFFLVIFDKKTYDCSESKFYFTKKNKQKTLDTYTHKNKIIIHIK